MIPYGFNYKDYSNDSKRAGDISTGRRPYSRLLTRTVLRRFKKIERRNAKLALQEELNQGDINA